MGKVAARIRVDGLASEAERLWYDTSRWPTFVDGLHHVDRLEGDWPQPGARLVWHSNPGGRGRVVEEVTRYEARTGQTLIVEDAKIRGTQQIAFTIEDGGVTVELRLEYELKSPDILSPITDVLFIRRAQRDSLKRTLARFARELAAEREL